MAYKITFFNVERWGDKGREYLETNEKLKSAGVEMDFVSGILDDNHLPGASDAGCEILGVFSDSSVDSNVLQSFPSLKYITTLSTGYDHIDLGACNGKNITVSSVPAYASATVSEYAFALILALSRKIREASARVKDEMRFTTDGLCGFDLEGKTLGVVGTGRIGKNSARIGKGFGMNLVAYDVFHDDKFAAEMGMKYLSLEDLLGQSDVITIHAPYMPSTHHLINSKNIGLVKKGAYLINTARGAIVETAAVIQALGSGQLGGAGLDVLEGEAAMKAGDMSLAKELTAFPNVIMTPHNAFNSREAFLRMLDTAIDNIVAYTKGEPINVVKPAA